MGEFRSDRGGRGFGGRSGGSRFGGGSRGGFGGGRGGFRRDSDGPREMTKVICSKCKKECEVPFKPNSDKPVFCSDCFKSNGGSSRSSGGSSGMTAEQFSQINAKLDKIIKRLDVLEIEEDSDEDDELEVEEEVK